MRPLLSLGRRDGVETGESAIEDARDDTTPLRDDDKQAAESPAGSDASEVRVIATIFAPQRMKRTLTRIDVAAAFPSRSFENRSISVRRRPEGFRAIVTIAGQPSVLERIFVQASEGALLPSVQHIDLYGKTLNGAPLTERIVRS